MIQNNKNNFDVIHPGSYHIKKPNINIILNNMFDYIFKNDNKNKINEYILKNVYYIAVNNDYYKARDLLQMSGISKKIQNENDQIKQLYNRTLTQLGLAAFKNELI